MIFYCLIHQRLSKWRFVSFIVSKSSIAKHIYNYVSIKLLSKFCGYFCTMNNCFRIIAIYMKYWSLSNLSNFAWVRWWTSKPWCCCKAYLIIYNYMNCSACIMTWQTWHSKTLCNYSLPGKRSITVHQNWNYFFSFRIFMEELFCSNLA